MKYERIIHTVDDGGEGWRFKRLRACNGMPMNTNEAFTIAHDLLEHQNGLDRIGSIADELEALGGMIYIRRNMGVAVYDLITHDIKSLWELWDLGTPLRATGTPRVPRGHNEVENMVLATVAQCLREFQPQETPAWPFKDQLFKWTTYLIYRGYKKAVRRFRCEEGIDAAGLFAAVTRVVQWMFDEQSDNDIHVEFNLAYDMSVAKVSIVPELREGWWPEDYMHEEYTQPWKGCSWEDLGL